MRGGGSIIEENYTFFDVLTKGAVVTMQQKKGFILFCMLLLCLLCTPVIHAEADEKNTVVLDNAIPIEGYFEFRCLGDGIHSDDVTDYMAATYQSIESGMLSQALPTTFFYNGHDHMYLRAHVGNTQIYRIGVLKYGGVEHISPYFRTPMR